MVCGALRPSDINGDSQGGCKKSALAYSLLIPTCQACVPAVMPRPVITGGVFCAHRLTQSAALKCLLPDYYFTIDKARKIRFTSHTGFLGWVLAF